MTDHPMFPPGGPLRVDFIVVTQRIPRARCTSCGNRRVLFRNAISSEKGDIVGPALCAKCAGVR